MHREKARFSAPWDRGRVLISVSVISSYLKVDFLSLRIKNNFQNSRYLAIIFNITKFMICNLNRNPFHKSMKDLFKIKKGEIMVDPNL